MRSRLWIRKTPEFLRDPTTYGPSRRRGGGRDLPGGLNPGITAAHHDEGEQPAPDFGAGFDVGLLDPGNDGGAQQHGVPDVLHEEGVLRHSRNPAEIDLRPERENQITAGDDDSGRKRSGVDENLFLRQIERSGSLP